MTTAPAVSQLELTTATAGDDPDPDGYQVTVDDKQPVTLAANDTTTLDDMPVGGHLVTLSGLADNCQVTGSNPLHVLTAADSTTEVNFAIECSAITGPPPPPPPPGGGITQWTQLALVTDDGLQDIWGSAANDIFAVGFNKTRLSGTIVHYDGSAWTINLEQPDVAFQGVWGAAGNDVFAVGSHNATAAGAVLHYNGSTWSELMTPDLAQPGDTTVQYRSVWGLSPTDVFAVGAAYGAGPTAIAEHYDGQQWTPVALPAAANRELLDAWGSSDHDIYLVGDIQNTPTGRDQGVIDHFDGSSWTETLYGDDIHLKAVWGTGANDVFTVGDDGIVLHFDGSSWTRQHTPITKAVHEIWGSSATDVIAVAAHGIVLHYDGASWTQMTSPTDRDLFGVWGSGSDNAWAVGLIGVILHGTP